MKKFLIVAGFLGLLCQNLHAQHKSIKDTIFLPEVSAIGAAKKYQAGAKIESVSPQQMQIAQEGGIDQVLMRFSPIYLKSNAGGLSSIHFRGTSSNHTTVTFGGITLNSLTLGSADMSAVPAYLFDGLDLQYGSSSAVNGSGAVGGSLALRVQSNWTEGLKVKSTISQGSFGEQFYGAKVFAGNGRWETVSRLYYFYRKNDFPFKNPYTGNVEDRRPVNDRQHGASIENMGLIQEINYRFNRKETLKSSVWLEHDWHQVQPNMSTNLHYVRTEDLDNKNIRVWSEYESKKHPLNFRGGLGYVHDMQVYDKDEAQKIGTDRLVSELEVKQDFTQNFGAKGGVKYEYIVPDVYSYSDTVIDYEQHLEAYMSAFLQFQNRLRLTLNMRQMYVTNYSVPFTPSVGAEYRLYSDDKMGLKLTSNISKSYRVPTFNDRYWGTQGNPNLKPENGMNYELGGNFLYSEKNIKASVSLNAFYMNVEDWIEWRNYGTWQAQNVKEVESKGIEFQGSTDIKAGRTLVNFKLNYNFNQVEAVKDYSETGRINEQLIYTPKHMGNVFAMVTYRDWAFNADGSYTGARFSDDMGNEMEAYFLANCGISRKVQYKNQLFNLSFSVKNLFDTNYENERFYAMQGRNFRISLSMNLNVK